MLKRISLATFTLALVLASALVPRAGADLGDLVSPTGVGETLVLVVADGSHTLSEAAVTREEANARFGDLQGFSVDEAAHYDVTGALVQVTPDTVPVACPESGAVFETVLDGTALDLDCPAGRSSVDVLRPVDLAYVPAADYPRFPSPCGDVGEVPCQEERYRELLGDDLAFEPGAVLLLSAFRTKQGAEEFVELARAAGVEHLVVVQARKLGGGDVGLGQEPAPDGSGPLVEPLADQESYQR